MEWFLHLGYFGLFMGSFLAGTVLPLSSDLLIVAILVAGGDPVMSLIIGSAGNWAGSLTSYWLGWVCKWDWLEKWFRIKQETLEKQKIKIDKYGPWLALFPWFPVVGILGIIALGFYKVSPKTVAVLMLTGCFLRFLFWVVLYHFYGDTVIGWVTK